MNTKGTIKSFFLKIKLLKFIWRKMSWYRTRFYLRFNPKVIANREYKSIYNKNIKWHTPINLIEKRSFVGNNESLFKVLNWKPNPIDINCISEIIRKII